MGKKTWTYANADSLKVGPMICTCCRKPIETGEYRYRETRDEYLPQHRHCCEFDPTWAKLDARRAGAETAARAFEAQLQAFMREHKLGADDLHDIADAINDGSMSISL